MNAIERNEKLNFSRKLSRLVERMKEPEWRRHFRAILVGKALGLALLFFLIVSVPAVYHAISGSSAYGQATTAPSPVMIADLSDITKNPCINPINTAWTLV